MKTSITVLFAITLLVVGSAAYYVGLTRAQRPARAIAVSNDAQPAPPTTTNVGNFQIVPGEYLYTVGDRGMPQHGVFRINTETGESELFREFIDDKGALKLFWDTIE